MNLHDTIPFVLTLLPKGEEPGSMDEIEIMLGDVKARIRYAKSTGWQYAGEGDRDLAELWRKSSWPDKFPHGIPSPQVLRIRNHTYFLEWGGPSFPNTLWVSKYLSSNGNYRLLLEFDPSTVRWREVEHGLIPNQDIGLILTEVHKHYPHGLQREGGTA